MSNKRKQNGGRDLYKEMYDRQFEKFNNMDKEKNGADDDLRFYSEEELDAIEQAKRDAAERAYQDAYREQYNRSKNQRKKVGSEERHIKNTGSPCELPVCMFDKSIVFFVYRW